MTLRRAALLVAAVAVVAAWGLHYGVAPVFPHLAMPVPRKLAEIARTFAALAVIDLAALGASAPLVSWLASGGRLRRATLRLGAGLALLGTALGVLGVLGLFSPPWVLGSVVVAALGGVVSLLTALRSSAGVSIPNGTRALLAGVALLLSWSALHAFVPLYGWDALTYHLALPEWCLRHGRIGLDHDSIYTSFPMLVESLYAAALALHGPALAKLVHLQFAALALVLVADVARQHAPRAWPVALIAVAADPTFLWETTVVYNDLALVFFATATFEAMLATRDSLDRSALRRAALFAGACAGTRYPGLLVPVSLGAAWALRATVPPRERRRLVGALAAGSALFLAPWLVRNTLASGNPFAIGYFHPVALRQMLRFNAEIGMGHGVRAFFLAPLEVTLLARPDRYVGGFGYVLGPLHLVGLASLAVAMRRPLLRGVFLAVTIFFVGWFATVQESRYLLPITPWLAYATALAVEDLLPSRRSVGHVTVAVIAAAALALAFTRFSRKLGPVIDVSLGPTDAAQFAQQDPAERIGDALRNALPAHARLLPLFESRAWHLRGLDAIFFHVNQGAPVWAEIHDARVEGHLCAWLARRGVTHVLVNRAAYEHRPPLSVAGYSDADIRADMDAFTVLLQHAARPLFHVAGEDVYTLVPSLCVDATGR